MGLCREAVLVDISHDVPPFRVLMGQNYLRDAINSFPPGTIHLAVVDPGVGSPRRPVVVVGGDKASGHYFVGPDNGLFWPFARGGKVYELANAAFHRPTVSPTFHGRDIFAPTAAYLAMGVPPQDFGPPVTDLYRLSAPRVRHEGGAVVGEIVHVDSFGNLISNLGREELPEGEWGLMRISVGGRTIEGLHHTYSEAAPGKLLALIGSAGFLEIAMREGCAAAELKLEEGIGMPVVVEKS